MTEVESKFIIMARIAVELGRLGCVCSLRFREAACYISVLGGDTHSSYDYTEQELLDWLEELQEKNNDKA